MTLRYPILIAILLATTSGCNSVNTAALRDNEVSVDIKDRLFFCTIKVKTNPRSCQGTPYAGVATDSDVCITLGSTVEFTAPTKRENQFLIVAAEQNPFFAPGSSAPCSPISREGVLSCDVKDSNISGSPDSYKYWVFGQGCSQSLDPRVYVIRNR